ALVHGGDPARVALVLHHPEYPAASRKRRTDSTHPLLASLPGCGRWKTARTSFRATRTRDPRPSVTDAPRCSNSDSILRHSMSALVGVSNIAARVLSCLAIASRLPAPMISCQVEMVSGRQMRIKHVARCRRARGREADCP